MRNASAAVIAAALALSCPVVAQRDEAEPFFSLDTERTFGSAEKAAVRLWGQGIDQLQFRVYRVTDALKFFGQLEDPHQFGGRARRAPGELTALERFHRWKYTYRTRMRNLFRSQFTPDSRGEIRLAMARREQPAAPPRIANPVRYADVPLLNQQQVVAVWDQPVTRGKRWETHSVPIPVKDKGVYVVEATNGKLQAYTIVCVTDIVLVSKADAGRVIARVLERRTGKPIPSAELFPIIAKQQQAKVQTDAEGTATLSLSLKRDDSYAILLARAGSDVAPLALSSWELRDPAPAENLVAYMYTDRPVYRPGHTVYFRGIVRARAASGYQLPPTADLQLLFEDPEGKSALRRTIRPNAAGTFSGEFVVPGGAALGYYGVSLRSGERYAANTGFNVEEYKKPEYEVRVIPEQPRILQGAPARAVINARYYFGEPVPGAKVTYVVHRSRFYLPWYREDLEEENNGEEDEFAANEQILEQTGTLDAEGKLTIQFDTETAKHDLRYRIEARVTDQAGREVSGAGGVLATQGSYFVHAEPDKWVYSASDQARLRVETRDYDGNPVKNAPFTVEVSELKTDKHVSSASGRTDENGIGSATVSLASGYLVARVTSRTPEGRDVQDVTGLWVSGGSGWDYDRGQRVEIVPDKKKYGSGDTARVLIVTGVPEAWLWITSESRGLYMSRMVHATSPTITVDVPVRGEYAPNFFVNATFVRDGQLYTGSKSLRVPPVAQKLEVTVTPSKPQFKPGETGAFVVEAKDHTGQPVSAEFSLGVVDEAIYAIRREAAQEILSFFYGRNYDAVSTQTSLQYRFHGESGKRRMQLAALNAARRAQLKPDKFADPNVRKAFPDTIYWVADLRTAANGRAEAPVTFPDALTTWRATARGITADTRVGSAIARTVVRKNLILRLAAPRFFRQGDEVTISAIVQNYLAEEKTVRVSLDVKGVALVEGATRDVKVVSRGSAQVDFKLRADTPGSAVLLGKALTNEESDALELTLPVNPYGVKLSEAAAGSVSQPGGRADALLTFPADANAAGRTIAIGVSPSVAGAVFGALDYLTSFPYGCTEQTMSSFLPNVIVARAAKELSIRTGIDEPALAKKIRAGLERLYDYQHEDGGWGWWKTDDSQAFMTAYVIAGLARARASGVSIRDGVIDRGVAWLKSEIPKLKGGNHDIRAYIAYTLAEAGAADAALVNDIWEHRSSLTPYGIALAGIALRRAGETVRANTAADLLERAARSNEREAWWQMGSDPLLEILVDATVEATAWSVKFLSEQRPDTGLLPKAALYLISHRDQGYYWASTKQTAMVVFGLTDYLKHSRELRPNFSVTVSVNDKPVLTRRFTERDALAPGSDPLRLEAAQLAPGANRISISKTGEGTLYWNARAEFYSTAERHAKAAERNLGITREYFRLVPEKSGDRIVHRLEPLGSSVQRGEVIAVRLRVIGSAAKYLMVEDPIPAGAEFIQRDDLYELKDTPPWWARWYARREFHDDRAALFQTWFPSGESEQSYLLKVFNSGRFRISPARVEPMYEPEYFATTEAKMLEVR